MKIKTARCRHGEFRYFADDMFVGRSLELYGEYSESECFVYQLCVKPGDTAIFVGANIGSLVVPLARQVCHGRVIAYEPQPQNCALLRENLLLNDIDNVTVMQTAAGAVRGDAYIAELEDLSHHNYGRAEVGNGKLKVHVAPIDDLDLDRLDFMQIDAEGSEHDVLVGAELTIQKYRPTIYIENDRQEKSDALIGWLVDHDYRCYWHRPFLFNVHNFNNEKRNVFGEIVSINMVCVPGEKCFEVRGLDEVADLRVSPDMYEREFVRFDRELLRHPQDMTARLLCAHYSNLMQRVDDAKQLINENLAVDPDHTPTLAIKGLLDLQQGNYAAGWPGYEWRYAMKDKAHFGGGRTFDVPKWDGKSTDEPVLIWSEQGFGDNIMFARFMKEVLHRAPNAILETQPQLYELFELSNISPMGLYRKGRTLPPHSYHCSLPSLPAVLGLTQRSELQSLSYLRAEPTMVETWCNKLRHFGLKIGVCYLGSPRSERPWSRNIMPDVIDPILQEYSPTVNLTQEGQFESYADTAACISALDLVISVDTSVAHLAGALGVPTWLLLSFDPDWRWGLHGDNSVWYPRMRIFRQRTLMDWSPVIDELRTALTEHPVKSYGSTA